MKKNTLSPLHVLLFSLILIFQFSCSKDSDLLYDYVLTTDAQEVVDGNYIVDDTFVVSLKGSIVLDVLKNDRFNKNDKVKIKRTSSANNGKVEINEDNTITYTPNTVEETPVTVEETPVTEEDPPPVVDEETPVTDEETPPATVADEEIPDTEEVIVDTFTYTVEVVTPDETVNTETATVTVTTTENRAPITGDNVYYVTTTGKSNNNGATEATAWNIQHAFATAMAGDIIYVKAGNYASTNITTIRSGTSGNPIKFIGYTTTPGDIVAFQGPTYDENDWLANSQSLPDNIMPHLEANPVNFEPGSTDIGFKIDHDYIEFRNFMMSEYYTGIQIKASNIVLDNIIGFQFGNWDPNAIGWNRGDNFNNTNRNGRGIDIGNLSIGTISNIVVSNSIIIDAGMAAFFPTNANNVDISWSRAITYNKGNGTDYLFDFFKTSNSTLTDCFAWKNYIGGHESRALSLQGISDNNVVERFTVKNLRIQIENSRNNVLRDVFSENTNGLLNSGGLQISSQSNDNLFINWYMTGESIQFLGGAGEHQRKPHTSAGDDNYFINFIVRDLINASGNGLISFHRLSAGYEAITGGTNYVINMTADNIQWMVNANRDGTIHFYNSTFSNAQKSSFDTFYSGWPNAIGSYTATFTNCNDYSNAFPTITGTNITTYNPAFANIGTNDFTLTSTSSLKDIGMDVSTLKAEAANDFLGNARGVNGTYAIGAFEN